MAKRTREWAPFTEKAFYLAEFRERTLAIACADPEIPDPASVRDVLAELEDNRTAIVLLVTDRAVARQLDAAVVALPSPTAVGGAVWRALRKAPRVALLLEGGAGFAGAARA